MGSVMNKPKSKMGVLQLTFFTAINMMVSGIIMLPARLAQVGTVSTLSWLVMPLVRRLCFTAE